MSGARWEKIRQLDRRWNNDAAATIDAFDALLHHATSSNPAPNPLRRDHVLRAQWRKKGKDGGSLKGGEPFSPRIAVEIPQKAGRRVTIADMMRIWRHNYIMREIKRAAEDNVEAAEIHPVHSKGIKWKYAAVKSICSWQARKP